MAQSPVLKDKNPLIRLPFSSSRLPSRKEAPVTSAPSGNGQAGIVGIIPLPKHADSVDSSSACNRLKVAP